MQATTIDLAAAPVKAPSRAPWRWPAQQPQAALAITSPALPPALPGAARADGLAVQMLDGFRVWHSGELLPALPTGRVRVLLKLLLLRRRRPLSRHRLAALFWPDAAADSARNNLHVALHKLRRALGGVARLRLADEGYQLLPPGEVWVDAEQFVRLADAGLAAEAARREAEALVHYEQALALYQRDLLEEDDNEAALAGDAQALRDRLSEVLEHLGALRERRADWHACVRNALHHLRLDDCNELAHRRLMRCYAQLGQVQLAERQYRQCIGALGRQFGVAPSAETTALYRRIAARQH